MIALNLADFDLTKGIEHYFRLAVSLNLYLGRGLMIVCFGWYCFGLYQSRNITSKRIMGVVSTLLCISRIGCCVSLPYVP
jgi:hypothetical protein